MQVSVGDRSFWFVFVELFAGFFVSIAYMGSAYAAGRADLFEGGGKKVKLETFADESRGNSVHLIADTLLPGGFIPIVLRSQLYTYEKKLSKGLTLTLFIVTAVFYLVGGAMILIDHEGSDLVLTGIFALAVAAILIVDLVFLII